MKVDASSCLFNRRTHSSYLHSLNLSWSFGKRNPTINVLVTLWWEGNIWRWWYNRCYLCRKVIRTYKQSPLLSNIWSASVLEISKSCIQYKCISAHLSRETLQSGLQPRNISVLYLFTLTFQSLVSKLYSLKSLGIFLDKMDHKSIKFDW